MLAALHDWIVAAVLLACLIAVIHPRVPTGVLGTGGLAMIMVGLIYSFDDAHDPYTAVDIVCGGIGLCLVPVLWHVLRPRRQARAPEPAPETLPPELRQHVSGGSKQP